MSRFQALLLISTCAATRRTSTFAREKQVLETQLAERLSAVEVAEAAAVEASRRSEVRRC